MTNLIDSIFDTSIYPRRADKNRARLSYAVTVTILIIFTIFGFVRNAGGTSLFSSLFTNPSPTLLFTVGSLYGLGITNYIFTRRGLLRASGWVIVLLWGFSGLVLGFNANFSDGDDSSTLMVFVFLGMIFLRETGLKVITPIAVILLIIATIRAYSIQPPPANLPGINEVISFGFQMVGSAIIFYLFLRNTQIEELESSSEISGERLKLANLTTQIASNILRRTALTDTLNSAVTEISDNYPKSYHVQIFLLDEGRRNARLAASTGDVGRMLMERQHSLPVGSSSVIGQVTSSGRVVVARAGSNETIHRRNEFLPETVVEAAFPLRIGDLVIGALDMQSREIDAFPDEEVSIFQALADNIAIAIDNARLFEQTEARVRENEGLAQQANTALREVERLNRQLTEQSWSEYIAKQGENPGITIDLPDNTIRPAAEWTPTLSEAIRFNHIVQRQTSSGSIVSVPVYVRGQVIGAMEFELEGDGGLVAEDLDLIKAVSERFGLAVESARLYQESRRAAQREATLNSISSRLQSTNSVNTVLSEAARGLQETLGANKVAIRLGSPPAAKSGARKPGSEGNGS